MAVKSFWTLVMGLLVLLVLLACSPLKDNRESYLLITIENLPFNETLCGFLDIDKPTSGWEILCEESIRFTHMYTPSTQSQAAIASILSGKYPIEHGVWHNGDHFLSEEIQTVPELFLKNGWKTSFFSGGGSIWRKSGFAQGFEHFDDFIRVHLNSYYKPSKSVFTSFLGWLDNNSSKKAFFSFLYLPDLSFTSIPTVSEIGEKRASSYEGQMQYLSESLGWFFSELKKRNRWHNANIIVLGLNGKSNLKRDNEHDSYSLYSENVQVAYFYKPNTKPRDLGINWKVDQNYSLVDLGYSLVKKFKEIENSSYLRRDDILSQDSLKKNNEAKWILIESAWPQWRQLSNIRYSLRKDNMSYIFDRNLKRYNKLTDRLEQNAQLLDWENLPDDISNIVSKYKIEPWNGISSEKVSKLRLGNRLWDPYDLEQEPEDFLRIYKRSEDRQVLDWLATFALKQENWELLKDIGILAENPYWMFVSKYNLNMLSEKDWLAINNPCFVLFFKNEKQSLQPRVDINFNCNKPEINNFYGWLRGARDLRENYRERLVTNMIHRRIHDNIYKLNYLADLSWDISLDKPSGPSILDLLLSLNRYRNYNNFLTRRLELSQDEKIVY